MIINIAYQIKLLERIKEKKLEKISKKAVNSRIKKQKQFKNRIEIHRDSLISSRRGNLDKFLESLSLSLKMAMFEEYLSKSKEIKKSLKKKRRKSKKAYFGRGI